MSGTDDLIRARADAALARERLLASAQELQARLKPGALAGDAWEQVKDGGEAAVEKTSRAAREHPVAASAAGIGIAALLIGKPVARLFRRNREGGRRVKRSNRIKGD